MERAYTAKQKDICYKVRHDVFMNETGYIQKKNKHGKETDEFDNLSTTYHFMARYKGEPAGTVRLILPNKEIALKKHTDFGLPIEASFNIKHYKKHSMRIAEISRACVKHRFRGTKTIFYLWVELINFALSMNITDLVTNVNPETDKLSDAYIVYNLLKTNNLVNKNIQVEPKRPGIGKIRNFRFPLTNHSCCNHTTCKDGRIQIQIPQTLKLFTRVGILFTGEPVYCENIDMCAMPMNWRLKDIDKTAFGRFFKRRVILKKVANH